MKNLFEGFRLLLAVALVALVLAACGVIPQEGAKGSEDPQLETTAVQNVWYKMIPFRAVYPDAKASGYTYGAVRYTSKTLSNVSGVVRVTVESQNCVSVQWRPIGTVTWKFMNFPDSYFTKGGTPACGPATNLTTKPWNVSPFYYEGIQLKLCSALYTYTNQCSSVTTLRW